jgi:EpsI family protein
MQHSGGWFAFLKRRNARLATLFLIAQAAGLYAIARQERIPLARPLSEFPQRIQNWMVVNEGVVEPEVMAVLRADDVMTRTYYDAAGQRGANLFVAYFKSQRTGQMPHSPKNCLPGSGWMPAESGVVSVKVPGLSAPIKVNRYVVTKGENESLVLYWYQTRNRVVASEFRARFEMILDALRYNRTDTALVRVVVPVRGNRVAEATKTGEDFVAAFFMTLRGYLPS